MIASSLKGAQRRIEFKIHWIVGYSLKKGLTFIFKDAWFVRVAYDVLRERKCGGGETASKHGTQRRTSWDWLAVERRRREGRGKDPKSQSSKGWVEGTGGRRRRETRIQTSAGRLTRGWRCGWPVIPQGHMWRNEPQPWGLVDAPIPTASTPSHSSKSQQVH